MTAATRSSTILVTGATGYIGGRLARRLRSEGHRVRALARDPRRLAPLAAAGVECVAGDVHRPETLAAAVHGVDVAYYLIHSMDAGPDFAARDREGGPEFRGRLRRGGGAAHHLPRCARGANRSPWIRCSRT
jgi:uncharacterized protein YbjT (DUF2867 family)